MIPIEYIEAVAALVVVVVAWLAIKDRQRPTIQGSIKAHKKTKEEIGRRAKAKQALAEVKKRQAINVVKEEGKQIKKMTLKGLAAAVRQAFGKNDE